MLYKEKVHKATENACHANAKLMRFRVPHVPPSIVIMVLSLNLYTEYPGVTGNALNMFMLPDLLPSMDSEAVLLNLWWDSATGNNAITLFANTGYLLSRKKSVPVTSWDAASK